MSVKAVHIIPHDGIGGVEAAARAMASASGPDDYRLLLIAGERFDDKVPASPSPYRSPLDPRAWWRTARQVRAIGPRLVIASLWKSVPSLILCKLLSPRAKFVMTLNSDRAMHLVDRVGVDIGQIIADEVWADSAQTLARRSFGGGNGRAISFLLPMAQASAETSSSADFVVWARVTSQKGLDRALPVIAALRRRGIDARYDIYGPDDGATVARLQAQRAQLGLDRAVRFHDPVSAADLPQLAAKATFFLMPSRKEGMGIACAEAMQLGLVPVVTPVGEMASYVDDGHNGLLIDPVDPERTAARIARLLENPGQLEAMRVAARSYWQGKTDHVTSIRHAIDKLVGAG